MNKKLLVVVGLAVVLVLGVLFPRPYPVVQQVAEKLGAVVGNEIQGNEFIIGGVKSYFLVNEGGGALASTTPCTIKSPNATTSILSLTDNFSQLVATSSGNTIIVDIATSTVRNATTSLIWSSVINKGVGHFLTLYATTSANPYGTSQWQLPPNTFINWGVRGRDQATAPGGKCTARLFEL